MTTRRASGCASSHAPTCAVAPTAARHAEQPARDVHVEQSVPQPEQPAQQDPDALVQEEPADEPAASGCDPNYTLYVSISAADLGGADIGFSVTIVVGDPHGFDGNDNDGLGCESH